MMGRNEKRGVATVNSRWHLEWNRKRKQNKDNVSIPGFEKKYPVVEKVQQQQQQPLFIYIIGCPGTHKWIEYARTTGCILKLFERERERERDIFMIIFLLSSWLLLLYTITTLCQSVACRQSSNYSTERLFEWIIRKKRYSRRERANQVINLLPVDVSAEMAEGGTHFLFFKGGIYKLGESQFKPRVHIVVLLFTTFFFLKK